jgi:replicative DNA helicase
VGELAKAPIWVDDSAGLTPLDLRAKARRLKLQHDVKLIMIDYMQLMDNPGPENRQQQISEISRGIKAVARELNIPVIALSQLNRASEGRDGHRPRMSDLRESGCLSGDTLITLAPTGERVSIRELVGRAGCAVFALNQKTLKLEAAGVERAFPTGIKRVYRLATKLGRAVRATSNHRFLTLDGWRRLDELRQGDRIALPRLLPTNGTPRRKLSAEEAALLGHLIGDGCTLPRHCIQYTTCEPDLADAVCGLARRVFTNRVKPRIKAERNWYQVYLASSSRLTHRKRNPVAAWLTELGAFGRRSYEKKIPGAIFEQPAPIVGTFLRHLWSTDGCVRAPSGKTRHPTVYYATSSRELAEGVQSLLLRLAINGVICAVPQGSKGRTQFHVIIMGRSDLLRFGEGIGAVGQRRIQALERCVEWVRARSANTNRDVIPKSVWRSHVVPAMERNGVSMRRMQAGMSMSFCGSTLYKRGVSRERLLRVTGAVGGDARLAALASSDVYWDEIASISPDGEEEVFDLTVPEHANFLAGDIIVHNSIEQDADVVMLLHREDYYRMSEPDFTPDNIAEVIVAKQRNGPTGTVKLTFLNKTTRFENLSTQADPF